MNQNYVYIITKKSSTLYTDITNDLERRVCEHKLETLRFAQGDRYGIGTELCVPRTMLLLPSQPGRHAGLPLSSREDLSLYK